MNELRSKQNRKNQPQILAHLVKLAKNYYSKLEKTIREKEN